jgi:hypothetical protein
MLKKNWLLLVFICLVVSMASAQTPERNMEKEA